MGTLVTLGSHDTSLGHSTRGYIFYGSKFWRLIHEACLFVVMVLLSVHNGGCLGALGLCFVPISGSHGGNSWVI